MDRKYLTEDQVRDKAKQVLGLENWNAIRNLIKGIYDKMA